MSIVDALKKLVVAFGGASEPEEVPGANVADVIEELAKNPPSGGVGAAPLVVNISPNNNGSIMDRTFQEIEDAMLSGRSILIHMLDEEENIYVFPQVIGSGLDGDGNIQYLVSLGTAGGSYLAETKDDYPASGGTVRLS